jgi:hypothetical protein
VSQLSRCFRYERFSLVALAVTVAAFSFAGCGGGGGGDGGGGGGAPAVTFTSFQGSPSSPGGAVPPTFRNEALLFKFSSALDPNIFGGFVTPAGNPTPTAFPALSSTSVGGVFYNAYVDQAAARNAVQIYDNTTLAQVTNVVIGRSVSDPTMLVINPVIGAGNSFGIPQSLGFGPATQFDIFVPAGSALTAGGNSVAPFGALPPVAVPPFSPQPPPATLFVTGAGFAPDTVPPTVVEVTTVFLNGANPVGMSIPANDTIRVTFSEPVDIGTVNLQKNVIIRNTSVTTTTDPLGVIVPVTQTSDVTGTVFFFAPQPSYGAGPYQIRVEVGTNASSADDIRDLPSGANNSQNSLANSTTVTFTTVSAPGEPTTATLNEVFESNTTQDTTFPGRYNLARWNQNNSGKLEGVLISGSAQPGQPKGTRTQFPVVPNGPFNPATPNTPTPFFSPFDDNGVNNIHGPGNPPPVSTVNPNGGSHSQFLYLAAQGLPFPELPQGLSDSIELVEWGQQLPGSALNPFSYNGFTMKLSHTTADASSAGSLGLQTNYFLNFDFDNPQNEFILPTTHPGGLPLNETPITVCPTQVYTVPALASSFVPFPNLNPLFDFDDGGRTEANTASILVQPSIVIDVDIPPVVQPSFNFVLGNFPTSPNPFRRLTGASGSALANRADNVCYHMRFTVVSRNSSARTTFYDLGTLAANANYNSLTLVPDISTRPAGTTIIVRGEAADGTMGGNPITVGGTAPSGLRVIYGPSGTFSPTALDALDTRRFCRFLVEFEANTQTNVSPSIDGFILGYSF